VCVYTDLDDFRVKGLGDVIHGAESQAFLLVLYLGLRGDENHRNCAGLGVFLELIDHLVAADPRHHDVQQYDIRPGIPGGQLQPLFTVRGDLDLVVVPQNVVQQFDVRWCVVHDQHNGSGFSHRSVPPTGFSCRSGSGTPRQNRNRAGV